MYMSIKNGFDVYSIIMPPPNITGVLHMGHLLNMTIQDVLIRYNSNKFRDVYWVPGLDHAAIATENRVIDYLKKEKNIEKENISREEFLKYCWEWKDKYGNTIIEQMKNINCRCNWDRLHFTLDNDVSDLVKDTFIRMFNDCLIYRSSKIVNWDCKNKTAISDEEVIYRDVDGVLYYLKYKFVDSDEYLIVATSRPETIFGDVAICVNPNDSRYIKFIGREVLVPIINRKIKIIGDDYVDKDFGSGCLKVTPCHDFNDYKLGEKHKLDFINILNDDGTLNEECGEFNNLSINVARKCIKARLQELDLILKEERYKTRIGFSERTNTVVEPRISKQWFIKMSELSKPALKVVLDCDIKFYPEKFVNVYKSWMENINDWCISRQLYWGHRIPIFYYKDKIIAAHDVQEASKLLNCDVDEIEQDKDVLDTWFSASLWPIVCTEGLLKLPTNDLITGHDIIFFWVARMIVMTYYLKKEIPFRNVYFTGLIRDNKGRKMSKSLGNSPDVLDLINKYGSDGVRFGILLNTQAGNDLKFDEKCCKQGRNFVTKIKNAYRLLNIWKEQCGNFEISDINNDFDKGVCLNEDDISHFERLVDDVECKVNEKFSEYKINEVAMMLYRLFWDDFCSNLLETQKSKVDKIGTKRLFIVFSRLMKLLNPFIPEITVNILQEIN